MEISLQIKFCKGEFLILISLDWFHFKDFIYKDQLCTLSNSPIKLNILSIPSNQFNLPKTAFNPTTATGGKLLVINENRRWNVETAGGLP